MSIAATLFVRLMPNPIVNESLIDILRCAVADEAVAKDVPTANVLPFAFVENFRQMVPSVVRIQSELALRIVRESIDCWIQKQKRTRWLHLDPILQGCGKCSGYRN